MLDWLVSHWKEIGTTLAAVGGGGWLFLREKRRQLSANAAKTEAEARQVDAQTEVSLFTPVLDAYKAIAQSLEDRLRSVEARADAAMASAAAATARAQDAIDAEGECQRNLAEVRKRLAELEVHQKARLRSEGTPRVIGLILLALLFGWMLGVSQKPIQQGTIPATFAAVAHP